MLHMSSIFSDIDSTHNKGNQETLETVKAEHDFLQILEKFPLFTVFFNKSSFIDVRIGTLSLEIRSQKMLLTRYNIHFK